jgi:hypothetical protein
MILFLKRKKLFILCRLSIPLATYLGYYAEAGFAGYSCSGIATIDAGDQGFFFLPDTWVAD